MVGFLNGFFLSENPAFLATHPIAQIGATGNGTIATVNFTNVLFDKRNNYDGVNTFTSPVDGIYVFIASVQFDNLTNTATSGDIRMLTSDRQFLTQSWAYGVTKDTFDNMVTSAPFIARLHAGETAKIQAFVDGMGADTVDFPADTITETYFGGFLLTRL